jgi:hypothetical protein
MIFKEKLSDCVEGDLIYSNIFDTIYLYKIQKVGKVHLTTTHGSKINKTSGMVVGNSSWSVSFFRPVTPEIILQSSIQRVINQFKATSQDKITLKTKEDIKKLESIIEQIQSLQKENQQ